jgi:hypothetical protein
VIAGEAACRGPLVQALIPAWRGPLNRAGWPSTVVSWAHGEQWAADLLLPGHRESIGVDVERAWLPTDRVPRSVSITGPAELLRQASLTECPPITGEDPIAAPLIRRASRRATGLIYLLSGGRAWRPAEIEVLNVLTAAGVPLWVGLDKLPPQLDPAEVTAARSVDVAATYVAASATEDGRSSLAAALCALMLADPGETVEPTRPTPWRRLPAAAAKRSRLRRFRLRTDPASEPDSKERPAAMVVRTGEPWPDALDQAIAVARVALTDAVSGGLADVHRHCTAALADKSAGLAAMVDSSLYAVALRVTEAWQQARFEVYQKLLGQLLAEPPSVEAHRRLAAAQARNGSPAIRPYTLLVTATAAVATLTDEPDAQPREPFAGLDIALSDAGYAHLVARLPSERRDALIWLERATDAVADLLTDMVGRELTELQSGLAGAATEAVDHGLLLM